MGFFWEHNNLRSDNGIMSKEKKYNVSITKEVFDRQETLNLMALRLLTYGRPMWTRTAFSMAGMPWGRSSPSADEIFSLALLPKLTRASSTTPTFTYSDKKSISRIWFVEIFVVSLFKKYLTHSNQLNIRSYDEGTVSSEVSDWGTGLGNECVGDSDVVFGEWEWSYLRTKEAGDYRTRQDGDHSVDWALLIWMSTHLK